MQLTKYKLGDLITQRREKNKDYDLPIRGVSREGFIKPKIEEADTSIYNVFYKNDFVFNPARMELNSIALNLDLDKALCSSLYEVFYVKDENVVLPEFLNLHIKRDEFARHCDYIGLGSAREYCRFANIAEFDIMIPPIEIQREIVQADRQIKRRIRLNEQMIEKLEATAQALYRKMFVDGIDKENLPEGWRMGTLEDVVIIRYGKAHERIADGDIPIYGSGGIMRYGNKALFDMPSVLIPRKGSLNNIMYVDIPFWTVDTMFYTQMRIKNVSKYLYIYLCQFDFLSMDAGSAVPSMTSQMLNQMEILIPDEKTLGLFEEQESIIFRNINLHKQEISKLSELQSLLLVKMGSLKQ